ncbi:MAG: YdcH family protein [Spongiibacteraceae bacterium]|jgi:hypothetical protein|nr:YdcH family protein [Spongiibacteraceae bacterium]
MSADEFGLEALAAQLSLARARHRELDEEITRLESYPYQDQLLLRRLKKEKLQLKDQIQRLRAALIPDLDA